MESALSGRDTTLVLVTHDRAFLEALATGLLELDAGTSHQYAFGGAGCYDRYRQARPQHVVVDFKNENGRRSTVNILQTFPYFSLVWFL